MKDYYKILELEFGADILKVKKAYRRIAYQKFIEITEAYEVLQDPLKKSEYDNLYQSYLGPKSQEQYSEQKYKEIYQRKQQEWADYGREKAKEYSSIPFEVFMKQILKKISVGAGYIPNIIAILFVSGGAIGILTNLPKAFEDDGGLGLSLLIIVVALGYLAYRLFLVAQADYHEEKKHKNLNDK